MNFSVDDDEQKLLCDDEATSEGFEVLFVSEDNCNIFAQFILITAIVLGRYAASKMLQMFRKPSKLD